jgi:hypothetical protein
LPETGLATRRDSVAVVQALECDRANGDRDCKFQHREGSDVGRRRRRRQVAPIVVFDIDIFDGRRRRGRPEIIESVDRLFLIEQFVGRGRRKVRIGFRAEVRRRLELGR